MAQDHEVGPGECISSIAFDSGFFPGTLWDHPANADLKSRRKDPNVLLPGDVVHVPDLRAKEVAGPTGQRHTFRRKGVPDRLSLRLRDDAQNPIADEPFELRVAGQIVEGRTGADGRLSVPIPPNAASAQLTLKQRGEVWTLRLGEVDPIDTVSGVQARLNNLGFPCGKGAALDDATRAALRMFQDRHGLEPTGEIDGPSRARLLAEHGI
jgi:hypothetical protein